MSSPPGSVLSDVLLWMRRIIKAPSVQSITDDTLITYVNRFMYELPEKIQLFEFKRQFTFETQKNRFIYQFPYQNYQMLMPPCYCDGVEMAFYLDDNQFYAVYPEMVFNQNPLNADGTAGPYTITLGQKPILRGFTDDLGNLLPYVYVTATNALGVQQIAVDNGLGVMINVNQYLQPIDINGNLIDLNVDPPISLGTVDYDNGIIVVTFLTLIPGGNPIRVQTSPFSAGFPRITLFFNNTIKLYPVPDKAYKIQFDASITPAQFLNSNSAVTFFYMAEYIARGAARKILSDSLDEKQFNFYENLFREQENFVLRRTARQRQKTRTSTIFSAQTGNSPVLYTQY